MQAAVVESLFQAYFTDGCDLSDTTTLAEVLAQGGLGEKDFAELLAGDRGVAEVREWEQKAQRLGISGVPFFVLNGAVTVSGAQLPGAFRAAIELATAGGVTSECSRFRSQKTPREFDMIQLIPIGYVRNTRVRATDNNWGEVISFIELTTGMPAEAFDGIVEFSDVEVIYHFDRVADTEVESGSRHPRGNTAWPKVGILAQRGKGRLNRLGACIAELVFVRDGRFELRGLDAIDGTRVLDIKPVIAEFLPHGEVRQPSWSHDLMRNY